jgi:hypothetical protein
VIASIIGCPIAFRNSAETLSIPGALPALCRCIAYSTSSIVALFADSKALALVESAKVISWTSFKSASVDG